MFDEMEKLLLEAIRAMDKADPRKAQRFAKRLQSATAIALCLDGKSAPLSLFLGRNVRTPKGSTTRWQTLYGIPVNKEFVHHNMATGIFFRGKPEYGVSTRQRIPLFLELVMATTFRALTRKNNQARSSQRSPKDETGLIQMRATSSGQDSQRRSSSSSLPVNPRA